jgi:hypothetical protein
MAVIAITAGGLVWVEVASTNDALEFEKTYTLDGGYVVVVTGEGGVDRARCEQLGGEAWTVGAGSTAIEGPIQITVVPGDLYQHATITRSALAVIDPTLHPQPSGGPSWLAGDAVADEISLTRGSRLDTDGDAGGTVAAIVSSRRNPIIARSLIALTAPTGHADDCWVELTPATYTAGTTALAAAFTTNATEYRIRPVIRRDELTRDPAREFSIRPQKDAWLAIGLATALFIWMTIWLRRSGLSLYLALGLGRLRLITMLQTEIVAIAIIGYTAGTLWALAIWYATDQPPTSQQIQIAATTAGSATLLAVVLAPFGTLLLIRGSIASMLKE